MAQEGPSAPRRPGEPRRCSSRPGIPLPQTGIPTAHPLCHPGTEVHAPCGRAARHRGRGGARTSAEPLCADLSTAPVPGAAGPTSERGRAGARRPGPRAPLRRRAHSPARPAPRARAAAAARPPPLPPLPRRDPRWAGPRERGGRAPPGSAPRRSPRPGYFRRGAGRGGPGASSSRAGGRGGARARGGRPAARQVGSRGAERAGRARGRIPGRGAPAGVHGPAVRALERGRGAEWEPGTARSAGNGFGVQDLRRPPRHCCVVGVCKKGEAPAGIVSGTVGGGGAWGL